MESLIRVLARPQMLEYCVLTFNDISHKLSLSLGVMLSSSLINRLKGFIRHIRVIVMFATEQGEFAIRLDLRYLPNGVLDYFLAIANMHTAFDIVRAEVVEFSVCSRFTRSVRPCEAKTFCET